jgi:phospholipid/cholesterol/gamma-HCH transport system substrate-binding protein
LGTYSRFCIYPIREDTQARLTVAGITGTSNIQFSSGSQTSPLLEGKDDEVPIIIATLRR